MIGVVHSFKMSVKLYHKGYSWLSVVVDMFVSYKRDKIRTLDRHTIKCVC